MNLNHDVITVAVVNLVLSKSFGLAQYDFSTQNITQHKGYADHTTVKYR